MLSACLEPDLSFGCASAFLFLLVLLHKLKPELDPSWHMISEYTIGSLRLDDAIGDLPSASCFALFLYSARKV
jgi:hypothetical protein